MTPRASIPNGCAAEDDGSAQWYQGNQGKIGLGGGGAMKFA